MFCIECQHLETEWWVQGGEAFSWLCLWEEEKEKAAMRLATSLKWAAENLFERDCGCQPKKTRGAVVQSKPVLLLAAEDPLDDLVWLFSQGGPGAAACQPSVPARLQPKQLSAETRTDSGSHFGRWGGGNEGGVVQSSVLRRIISVNEFLFSCKSCDWLHQTPLADKIWRAEEYGIKNACVMQSHTCLIALLPAAHPACHWLHWSYIRLRTYFKETPTI